MGGAVDALAGWRRIVGTAVAHRAHLHGARIIRHGLVGRNGRWRGTACGAARPPALQQHRQY
jgi:hypothetical protein